MKAVVLLNTKKSNKWQLNWFRRCIDFNFSRLCVSVDLLCLVDIWEILQCVWVLSVCVEEKTTDQLESLQ